MKEEKRMTTEEMAAEVKSLNRKRRITCVLTGCALLAAIIMTIAGNSILALVFLVIALVFWIGSGVITKSHDETRNRLEKVTPTEQIEAKLKSMSIKAKIYRILTCCAVAAAILMIVKQYLISTMFFLFCVLVIEQVRYKKGLRFREVKELLGERVVNDAIRDVLGDDVEYDPSGALEINRDSVVVPFGYDRLKGTHYIKTVCNGVNLELGSILYLSEQERTYGEGSGSYIEKTVHFRGPWMICDFGKKPACGVYISQRTKNDLKRMESNVKIDNEPFGSRFCVRADDPQEAYKILTPQMMEAISAVADKNGGPVYMSFLPDGKMHMGIQTGHNLFDVGKGYNSAEGLRQKFSEELRRLADIVDMLNV